VGLVRLYRLQSRLSVAYSVHLETLSFQSVREHLLDRRLIVD
jgi:hypothetical protein